MEPRVPEKHITPKKTMQNILYEQVQGRFGHANFNPDSPFRCLTNFSTPPSRFTKIFNPFEAHLTDKLHLPVFSPSVFNKKSPKTDENFKWTIDEISCLKPADIDVNSTEQFELTDHDSLVDMRVQEKINLFFSEKVIVPSPLNQAVNNVPLITDTPPEKSKGESSGESVAVQTLLSLPPTLPKHIEDLLKPYFINPEMEQQETNDEEADLYKKLFDFEDQRTPESVHTSPALSVGLSPLDCSPFHSKSFENARNSGIRYWNSPPLRDCNLSPIETNVTSPEMQKSHRSATKLNFSGHMSVDSTGIVPDNGDGDFYNKSTLYDSPNNLQPLEELSYRSNNWDMEYRHVSLESPKDSPNNSLNEMDVSNSNTPRSKIFISQRKKLSDSFLHEEFPKGNKENVEPLANEITISDSKQTNNDDNTDAGYQTGSTFILENSSWSNTYLFASTPTKSSKK